MADRTIRTILTLVTDQFESALQRAGRAAQGLGDKTKQVGDASSSAMQRIAKSARENSTEWRQVGGVLTAVGAATTGLMGTVYATGISYNQLRQTSVAALTSLLGSAEAATAQMDKLDAFASTSPFARDVFIRAQQQMLAFGIEARKVVPYLDAIQNAVAAAGGSNQDIAEIAEIFGKISASSKITAIDLQQFGRHGIDAATIIGSRMEMTGAQVRESITAGTLDARVALDALAEGMGITFEGAAAGVKDTFAGAVDRVRAAFRDISSIIAEPMVGREGGGLFTALLNQIADVMRAIEKLPDPILQVGGALTGLGGLALTAGGGFMLLAPRLLDTWDAARRLGIELPTLEGRLRGFNVSGFARGIGIAATALMGLAAAGRALALTVPDVDDGVEGLRARLAGLRDVGNDITTVFEDIEKSWYSRNTFGDTTLVSDLDDFQQKLQIMVDSNALQRAQRAIADFIGVADSSAQGQFETRIGQINNDLASLVQSGNAELAAELFDSLAMAAGGTDQAAISLINSMPEFRDALIGIANDAGMATDDVTLLKIALGYVTEESETSTTALHGYEGALEDAATAQAEAKQRLDDWIDAMGNAAASFGGVIEGYNAAAEAADTGTASMSDWISEMEAQAEAVANWRENTLKASSQIRDDLPADMHEAGRAFVNEMVLAGEDGAAALQTFVNGTPEQREALIRAWEGTGYDIGVGLADEITSAPDGQVGIDTYPADEALVALLGAIANSEESVVIDGNPVPAEDVLRALRNQILTTDESVTIDGKDVPARDVLNALMLAIQNEEEDVTINGNRVPADRVVGELLNWIKDQERSVAVSADVSQADRDVRNWQPPRKTVALGADLSAARREIARWSTSTQLGVFGVGMAATGGYGDHIARFAGGGSPAWRPSGLLEGPGTTTSDSILARLSRKEFVLNAAATSKLGVDAAYRLNSGRFDPGVVRASVGLADGGYAGQRYLTQYSPQPRAQARPQPSISLEGAHITGTFEIGGDGLGRIVDGRIVSASVAQSRVGAVR